MLNKYPLWKYVLIALVMVIGLLFALPNIYGEDPALQISANRGATVDEALVEKVDGALKQAKLPPLTIENDGRQLLARFGSTETQLEAYDVVREALGTDYQVALNLAPATPAWLLDIGALPMYLGLDLRGGVHFLMEVDMDAAVAQAEERYVEELRGALRGEKIRYLTIGRSGRGGIDIKFRDAEERARAETFISDRFADLVLADEDRPEGAFLHAAMREQAARDIRKFAVEQNITTLRNRVNELGVAEPVIQQQGENRIVVQLPGVQDTVRAKEILGATATLEFRMVDDTHDAYEAQSTGRVPPGSKLYHDRDGRPILTRNQVMLTGDYITDAASGIEQQTGTPAVFITLDGKGARIFSKATAEEVGKPMAVVYIENKTETTVVDGKEVKKKLRVEEVINVAVIREQLGKRFQVTGLDSTEEARNLALLLRAGALAAPIDIVEERTVGPSLGQENINQGFIATLVGLVAVIIFMALYYRAFGLVANMALVANVVLIVAVLSMLQATLTLPGIAGILLTVGMAVDANVLIFERIREEMRNGNTPQASIHAGYERAFGTIADANITTLIAAIVLFSFGTGPIKGFAVTLSIGIVTSMFTAIMGTRSVINLIYGGRRVKQLSI
jgi:preprotein translocase subunit SecD